MLPPATAWSRTRTRVRRWVHRWPAAAEQRASHRTKLPPPVAAYEFFDAVGAFLRKLASGAARDDDLAARRADLGARLDALREAVSIEPAATVHAYADCATLGEHLISLLAGLEGLVAAARSSVSRSREAAAIRPSVLRLAEAYERWADALADEGRSAASPRVPWGCIPPSPPITPSELEASQGALVEASNAVMRQLRSLVPSPAGEGPSARARASNSPTRTAPRLLDHATRLRA